MKKILTLMAAAVLGTVVYAQPKIVAHRGYWRTDGSAQNSITALQKAATLGCYGSEFDMWVTADGVPVVFHDATVDGIRIEDTTFATLMNHRLANGEFIPTLQQYLTEAAKWENCKIIFEIKTHRNDVRNKRAADMAVEMVRMLGLEKRTEYIAFSKVVCQRLHEITPESKIAYLSGDLTPAQVKEMGLSGIDYNEGVFRRIKAFLEDIKYEGVANFDMKYDERDGEYKLFEINLRQGRSSYFVTLNGFNLAKYFVDDLVEDTPFDGNTLFGRGSKLWLEIPKSIFLDYVAEGADKETGKRMLKSGDWGTTLEYSKDMNPLRWLMIRHMFSIYKKSYAKYFTKKGELK